MTKATQDDNAPPSTVATLPAVRREFVKSEKLADVCYDIRGPILAEAGRMEEEGHRILKLNIGNPAPWGFEAPEEILVDVIRNLPQSQGYCDSKGLFSARKAVMQYCQQIGIRGVETDDVYMGNGVSELISTATQALLNNGDEVLIPAPDYPLWTAAVTLTGARAVHYRCDERSDWYPDLDDLRSKVTPRTRALVVINPNNPTGALYEEALLKELVEVARAHDLVLFADEIYDKILFDDHVHVPLGSVSEDVLTVTFNGLSKAYRAAGFRTGWMVLSGPTERARDYVEGIDILTSMRLCANVPTQHAVQTALGGYQSIHEYTCEGGLLRQQRDTAVEALNAIDGISCVKPKAALYAFPKLDVRKFNITSDEQFVLDLLRRERILVVQGSGFNWPDQDHFRIVILPRPEVLSTAINQLGRFLSTYRQ